MEMAVDGLYILSISKTTPENNSHDETGSRKQLCYGQRKTTREAEPDVKSGHKTPAKERRTTLERKVFSGFRLKRDMFG